MPTLASASSGRPSTTNGSWSARAIRSASRTLASGCVTFGMRSANSSPPRRATVSVGRTTPESPPPRPEAKWHDDLVDVSDRAVGGRGRRHAGCHLPAERLAQAWPDPVAVTDRGPVVRVEDAALAVPKRYLRDARGFQAADR